MPHERKLRIKTLAMVFLLVLCANAGDLLLKHGMNQVGAVEISAAGLSRAFVQTVVNPTIWLAILFLAGFMFSYMTAVSWADYSYVMPAGAFGYAAFTFFAMLFLGETVSLRRWTGVALICFGVLLVGQGRPRTTEAPAGADRQAAAGVPQ